MYKEKGNTPAKMILFCVLLGIIVIIDSAIVIGSPYLFVRVLNLILIIILSSVLGAFIREIYILKKKAE